MSETPDYDTEYDDCCPNCGGEGIVYSCEDPCSCVDPEYGCDLCERRCDWCRPIKKPASPELQEVLREALEKAAISTRDKTSPDNG